jgi:hypothetical protein
MNKAELLDLAFANVEGNEALRAALRRYAAASSNITFLADSLGAHALAAARRNSSPNQSPILDTSFYTTTAVKLAVAEQTAWQALFDVAATLQQAGHDVNW